MAAEFLEARVLVPEAELDAFLAFCEEVLGTMPAINRVPDSANGHEVIEEIEAQADRRTRKAKAGE